MKRTHRPGEAVRSGAPEWLWLFLAAVALLLLAGCAKESAAPETGPHATIRMRNGGRYTGSVVSTSPTQLTLLADDNTKLTIDMKDVKSVDYGDAPAPAKAAAPAPPPAGGQAAAPPPAPPAAPPEQPHEDHYHPAEAAIRTRTNELRAGTQIPVRTEETIDSGKAAEGQLFAAEVTRDVLDADGEVVIPRGSNAQIIIRSAAKGGRFRGASDLILDLASVAVDGRRYELDTVDMAMKGHEGVGVNKRTGVFAGGGAAVGAIIGAIAGGGKGAAIGAGSGAGAGVAGEILTKGNAIRIPVETVLTFQLDKSERFVAR